MKFYSLRGLPLLYICIGTHLFADFIKIPTSHMTQSEAHMSIPAIRQEVEKAYHIDENPWIQQLWAKVIERERAFNETHYVFYSAYDNSWRLPQDFYLKLYEKFHPLTMLIENYRAFRWLDLASITLEEYLKKQMTKFGMVDDRKQPVKAYLMSLNLALFGNVGYFGECTFEYFLNLRGSSLHRMKSTVDRFEEILDIFNATPEFLEEVMALEKYLEAEPVTLILGPEKKQETKTPQTISQIFIPKAIVDEVAYLSWVVGVPYEPELVQWITKTEEKNPHFSKFKKNYEELKQLFKDKQQGHPLFKKVYEGFAQGKYAISPVLEAYKNTPAQVPDLNYLQARLIMTKDHVGSVGADIKVFDYDTISPVNKALYEKELNALVQKIFKERLEVAKLETELLQEEQEFKRRRRERWERMA